MILLLEFSIPLISLCCSLRGVCWILDAGWEKLGNDDWNKGARYINESGGDKNNKIGLLPKKTRSAPTNKHEDFIISLESVVDQDRLH